MSQSKVIAIDGPSGSGKSTVAKVVGQRLQLTYLDTGAMFRAIALHLHQKKIPVEQKEQVVRELAVFDFQYAPTSSVLVEINQNDFTQAIREHHVSGLASQYSQVPEIRTFLKEKQREIAKTRPSILEGRDIGTVIFPDAALKIFLTADAMVRAKRRLSELKAMSPHESYSLEKIYQDILERDIADQSRAVAPLVKAEDAIEIDTSHKSIDEIVSIIIDHYQTRKDLFA